MRRSVVTFGIVVILFLLIQGSLTATTFFAPRSFVASEAVLEGETIEVRSPVQAMVAQVRVGEDQMVMPGQILFVLHRLPTDATAFGQPPVLEVTALRAGVFSELAASEGQLVQADYQLGRIHDLSPEALRIRAHVLVEPEDVSLLQPFLSATVQASFLNGGEELSAVVTSVDPVYDSVRRTVDVRLRLLSVPADVPRSRGLPVSAVIHPVDESPSLLRALAKSLDFSSR